MTEKKQKSMEEEISEDKVDELVANWIKQNPAEFTVCGNPNSKRLRYSF